MSAPVTTMDGRGYRQKAVLALLDDQPRQRIGYLCRNTGACNKTVDTALRGLAARGLVRRVGYGVWERVPA